MYKIAILQFPGINTEYETRREINRAGMRGEFFRWNDSPAKLRGYDGYVIGGGFSYEDRGRAGIIASLDPIMNVIKEEAEKGKPVLGICNGAQILVESGLIPGTDGNKLALALARNRRTHEGKILGTGYYNAWVNLKCTAVKGTCMFTWNMNQGEILRAPIAHGEGRFTTELPELMPTLLSKGQLALRYCDKSGVILDQFPVNPNGAMFSTAAICNPAGNVMAVMPHLERCEEASIKLFTSMRDALLARKTGGLGIKKKRVHHLHVKSPQLFPLSTFQPEQESIQLFVSLIITDNEAETFEMALKRLGFDKVEASRVTHFEIGYKGKKSTREALFRKLIQSGILLNTNKETATVAFPKMRLHFDAKREKFVQAEPKATEENESITFRILVREKPDTIGMSKLASIQNMLHLKEITHLKTGTLWTVRIATKSQKVAEEELKRILGTHIFFNPHRQDAFILGETYGFPHLRSV